MNESEKLWIAFAKEALSGIASSMEITSIYNISTTHLFDATHLAAALADKMMNEYYERFHPSKIKGV